MKIQRNSWLPRAEVQKELKSNPEYVPALMAQAAVLYATRSNKAGNRNLQRHFAPMARFRARAETPGHVICSRSIHSRCRLRSGHKSAQGVTGRPELSELLGRLSYEKKEYPRAIQLLQESARKRPLDADSLFYLGMSQLQARQKTEAHGVLNQALVAGLQEPFATEAKHALADLQRE